MPNRILDSLPFVIIITLAVILWFMSMVWIDVWKDNNKLQKENELLRQVIGLKKPEKNDD